MLENRKKSCILGKRDLSSEGRNTWQDRGEVATEVEFGEARSVGIKEVDLEFQNGAGLDSPRVAQFVENDRPADGYKQMGRAKVIWRRGNPV